MADSMMKQFLRSMGIGLGAGLAIMTTVTVFTLPASYMMNKLIYHHPIMRLMAGIIAATFSIFTFPLVLIMVASGNWKPLHYFGLWPTIQTEGPASYTGWLAPFFTITNLIFHPFMMLYTGSAEDKQGYEKAMDGILKDKGSPGVVDEDLFAKARDAGAISDYPRWSDAVGSLSADFKRMFNGDAVVPSVEKGATIAEIPKASQSVESNGGDSKPLQTLTNLVKDLSPYKKGVSYNIQDETTGEWRTLGRYIEDRRIGSPQANDDGPAFENSNGEVEAISRMSRVYAQKPMPTTRETPTPPAQPTNPVSSAPQ
jgi:hypothetical protein